MFFFLLKQRRFYLLYVGEILSTVSFTEKWQTESHEITHLYSNQTVRRSLCIPEIAKKKTIIGHAHIGKIGENVP